MQIKWLGHASFLIISEDKKKIITDPFTPGNGINYSPINESADIVTRSHGHSDHNNTRAIKGNPVILTQAGTQVIKGIEFKSVPVFHDTLHGSQRGNDLIFCFQTDGLRLCHLGDLGHILDSAQLAEIGPVDILFIPVGGYYTITPEEATTVYRSIKPKLVFPMHYKNSKADYPIAGVDTFLKGKTNVRKLNSSEIDIKPENLPEETQIIVLQSVY